MSLREPFSAIYCPLCDYWTGISKWSQWGEQNARGALASHLCRKKHALTWAEAREKAKTAEIGTVVWVDPLNCWRKRPQAAPAIVS